MKRAILLVAYGPGNPAGRFGLASFEACCHARYPAITIRWAYTSPVLRERLARQKQKSDSVSKALLRLYYERYEAIAIQPLHTIPGREFEDICHAAEATSAQCRMRCRVGRPLLEAGPGAVAEALLAHIPEARQADEDVIFMGHGAKHNSDYMYGELGQALGGIDKRVFIGTMGGTLSLDTVLPLLTSRVVWLLPLLSSIGLHALRDMAGSQPASWKARLEQGGHECRPVLTGLAESPQMAEIWLQHLDYALAGLNDI